MKADQLRDATTVADPSLLSSPEPVRTAPGPTTEPWWRNAVVYQTYVRSFRDADGDGIGDLAGVQAELSRLAALGVDAIWLNPCYTSPQHDHGYDIADYFAIDPVYGDVAELEALVSDAHGLGTRVVIDLVANHCSVEHAWFQEALRSTPGSPARERFLFRDGRGADGELPTEQLATCLQPGLDPGDPARRPTRAVVPPHLRHRTTGLQLAQPRGRGPLRAGAPVLVRPRCRRLPHRRRPRARQAP